MPIEVPSEPRIYTTKYNNFRGVDFTNDPSNIWSHRSPNAKNMMPDLSGRPWKRPGWKVEKSAQDFRDCYNAATSSSYDSVIVPQKTMYFEIGGQDYLAICNNLGLFFYSNFIESSASDEPYLMYIHEYYGEVGTADENTPTSAKISPDANRGLFFESGGTAGFYIFCMVTVTIGGIDTKSTSLFRFDGEKLRMVDPYVPTLLISKPPGDAGGVLYETANILTLERKVMFYGDGSSKDFVLPEKANTSATFTVEKMTGSVWSTLTSGTDYSTANYSIGGETVTKIAFTSAPANSTEDNIRVTYSISGNNVSTTSVTPSPGRIGIGTRKLQTRTLTYENDTLVSTTPWSTESTETLTDRYRCYAPNIVITNNVPDVDVYMKTGANTWSVSPVSASVMDAQYTAYSDTLSVFVTDQTGYYYTETEEASNPTERTSNVDSSSSVSLFGGTSYTTVIQQRYLTNWKYYGIKVVYSQRTYSGSVVRNAFEQCSRASVFGDGLNNSIFMTGSTADDYRSRVWWSEPTDPSYWPDTNYIEAGSNDTRVAGLIKVGEFLGIIKQGQSTDSTIYLAYKSQVASGSVTSTNSAGETVSETTYDVTYAIKSSIGGVGAISNGAFNTLNSEPLFLARDGIMGIEAANENEKQLRNRSFYVNKRLLAEGNLEAAFSFVWQNMYILCVNNHCYVLDGAQKSSWANEKTNLQYEAYYWDNIPAQCFARYNEQLWFTDTAGRLCRFKERDVDSSYHDDYDVNIQVADDTSLQNIPVSVLASNPNVKVSIDTDTFWSMITQTGQYAFTFGGAGYLHRTLFGRSFGNSGNLDVSATDGTNTRTGDSINAYLHDTEGWHLNGEICSLSDYGITITDGTPIPNDVILVNVGNPIYARWTTALDDDDAPNYFKSLRKKGTMCILYPQSSTGVKVYLKKDNDAEMYIGKATVRGTNNDITAPSDFYLKKKMKKYKRLQIICENDGFDETFGVDEIVKCYTLGNYSKNG